MSSAEHSTPRVVEGEVLQPGDIPIDPDQNRLARGIAATLGATRRFFESVPATARTLDGSEADAFDDTVKLLWDQLNLLGQALDPAIRQTPGDVPALHAAMHLAAPVGEPEEQPDRLRALLDAGSRALQGVAMLSIVSLIDPRETRRESAAFLLATLEEAATRVRTAVEPAVKEWQDITTERHGRCNYARDFMAALREMYGSETRATGGQRQPIAAREAPPVAGRLPASPSSPGPGARPPLG